MVNNKTALQLKKIFKYFDQGQRTALENVSLEVESGKKVAIVGRSGSGKSTLLHIAAGIETPSKGEVSVFGQRLDLLGERDRTLFRRDQIGLIFQFFYLLPHLSVGDNIALPELIAGTPISKFTERIDDLLQRVGLLDRKDDSVDKLSGGEMQRIAICRALLRRPRLLLADEPTGNLDDENARSVMQLMVNLSEQQGSTLVYVTHSGEMATMADEIWTLHSGILER
jgi:ABC-type lipoprotein export system ATPase subunit